MNAREQYLQKQNQRLQNQVHFLLDVLERMQLDHDFLGSVACGVAWDASAEWQTGTCSDPLYLWETAETKAEAFLKLDEMTK